MEEWRIRNFLISGRQRSKVAAALLERPKSAKELSRELGLSVQNIARIFREFEKIDLARNITAGKRNRVFLLTKDGKVTVRAMIKEKLIKLKNKKEGKLR